MLLRIGLSLIVLWMLLGSQMVVAGPLMMKVGAGYENTEFEGGFFGTGPELQAKLDYVFYKPAKVLHFTVGPSLSYSKVSGSKDDSKFSMTHSDAGAEVSLIARILGPVRMITSIAYRMGIGGTFSFGKDDLAADNYQALSHSWSLMTPTNEVSRIGGGVTWHNSSFDLADESIKGNGKGIVISGFYVRRI